MNPNYSQQWYFKKEDLLRTPSIHSGYTYEQEKIDRAKGCSFILTVGMTLKLPQVTLATATVFLHRFYMRRSLKDYNYYEIGATCIFLATKVEETGRKMKDIVVTVAAKASKKDDMQLSEGSKEYNKWRDTILYLEEVLLEAICFDLTIEHPYQCLLKIIEKIEGSRKLAQTAWAFVNDSLRTPLCVIHKPHVIAAAALYLAAKLTNPELIAADSDTDMVGNEKSNNSVGNWWNHVDATIHDIEGM
ncbi:hypothetical protein BC937DRAFT_91845 [Endogone sp. FLAS-F59071]|nr:hypothetical protein BC937DRAFT_91845 [Endogone sp. FLAS-F59071]|eukprot:RUS23158.1 hypothetical protein BC937DRAFT_91845 [Endogone sp. FLAS-F59071]